MRRVRSPTGECGAESEGQMPRNDDSIALTRPRFALRSAPQSLRVAANHCRCEYFGRLASEWFPVKALAHPFAAALAHFLQLYRIREQFD